MSPFPVVTDRALGDFTVRLCNSHIEGGIFYESHINKQVVNVPKGRNCSYWLRIDSLRCQHVARDTPNQSPFPPLSQTQKMKYQC